MATVALCYEGGERKVVETEPFETVYQAAARTGVPILTDCLEGACATCKARCVSGEYDLNDPSFEALSPDEEAAGHVLLCQMEARTDCVVEMPYSLGFAEQAEPGVIDAQISRLETVGPDIVGLRLLAKAPLEFVPGQYAQIEVPGSDQRRAYSFANRSAGTELEFYVRMLPGGLMGEYLRERAAVGDRLRLEAPLGGFYLRPGTGAVVMIAGGTGLAPLLSMLGGLAESAAATGSTRPVRLLHGARTAAELFGDDRFAALATAGLAVEVQRAVDVGAGSPDTSEGPVTALLTQELVAGEGTDIYICGPPPMVAAAEGLLAGLGVPVPRVFAERFTPA